MVDDDEADVRAARSGDDDAFARLVARHTPAVASLVRRFTRDPLRLEELVQDTFVEAHRGLHGFAGDAPLVHWLRRIGTRVGYRFWTRHRREQATVSEVDLDRVPVDDPTAGALEAAEWVHALLARLRPRDRLVLTLVHLEDCTMAEVAALTGWSLSMVKVQAHRARKRLAAVMEESP